jgi:hypothetical protein
VLEACVVIIDFQTRILRGCFSIWIAIYKTLEKKPDFNVIKNGSVMPLVYFPPTGIKKDPFILQKMRSSLNFSLNGILAASWLISALPRFCCEIG